jgi:cytoskeletal protein CcmA (bactofilin family)
MKQLFGGIIICVLVLLSGGVVEAATVVRTGETVSVTSEQRVEGNFYALGSSLSLSGPVEGDVVAAAGTVSVNAPVAHDVLVLGGTVGVNASVTEDVRIVAGDVTIKESVGGSVFVLGGRLSVLSTATIAGDILVVAGDVLIEGTVNGQVLGVAERIRVDGAVAGIDVDTVALTLGDRAVISGDVLYTSAEEMVRAPGAEVSGTVVRSDAVTESTDLSYRSAALAFLVSLFASLSLYLVARRPLALYARQATDNIAREAFIGFALLVTVPVAVVVLMVSVLGLFLGLIGLAVFLMTVILALPLMNIITGVLIGRTFQNTHEVNILLITLGALTVQVMLFVPIIGPILLFILFLATFGGVATGLYRLLRVA